MTRPVRAGDDRNWLVVSNGSWSRPQPGPGEEFEHDITAGPVAGVALVALVLTLLGILVVLRPDGLWWPSWMWLILLGAVALVGALSASGRTWTIEAITPETEYAAGEHWTGTVAGRRAANEALDRAVRLLREDGRPDDGAGPLKLVTPVA